MKICFTTALFGDSSKLDNPGKFERIPEHDYFLFTDIAEEHFDTSWDIINIKDNPNISNLTSNVRKSRYPKFMSWELLESMGKYYDVIFYCDATYTPRSDFDWIGCVENTPKSNKFGFMQPYHYNHIIRNGGINVEMNMIANDGRDTKESMEKTRCFFERYAPNVSLDDSPYYENTIFGYEPNIGLVREVLSEFWKIYTTEDITYRDQPLWNFLLLKNVVSPIVCNQIGKYYGGWQGSKKCRSAFLMSGIKRDRTIKNYLEGDL